LTPKNFPVISEGVIIISRTPYVIVAKRKLVVRENEYQSTFSEDFKTLRGDGKTIDSYVRQSPTYEELAVRQPG